MGSDYTAILGVVPCSPVKVPGEGMRMYKVLHIIDSFRLGGAQTFLRDLVIQQQSSAVIEPVVCSLAGTNWISDQIKTAGIPVVSFDANRNKPARLLALPFQLVSMISSHQYDIIHTHLNIANILGRWAAIMTNTPVVVHEQRNETAVINCFEALSSRALNKKTARVICVSESTKDFNVSVKKVPLEKLVVIPNSIDLKEYSHKAIGFERRARIPDLPPDLYEYIVIGVGRLVSEKRYDLFLQAAAKILEKTDQVVFLILGEGSERDNLQRLASQLGLTSRVKFLGERDDVPNYLGISDVFMLLSDFEGLPLTVLEAMAMGLPVVATDVDGTGEVLKQGGGLMVERGRPDLAALLVLDLLRDQELRNKLAEEGQRVVRSQYSIENISKQIENVYREVLVAR